LSQADTLTNNEDVEHCFFAKLAQIKPSWFSLKISNSYDAVRSCVKSDIMPKNMGCKLNALNSIEYSLQ